MFVVMNTACFISNIFHQKIKAQMLDVQSRNLFPELVRMFDGFPQIKPTGRKTVPHNFYILGT